MVYLAFGIVALLALTLVYAYLVRPVTAQIMRHGRPAEGFSAAAAPASGAADAAASRSRLVYVYMDGCGWCERFNPVWASFVDEHGAALAAASVDAERIGSDDPRAEPLGVRSFPTVLFVPAGAGVEPVRFEGERTVEGLLAFVRAQGAQVEGFEEAAAGEPRRVGPPRVAPEGSANTIASNRPTAEQRDRAAGQVGAIEGNKGL